MTLETKLFSKLEPHAKRIKDGDGNDFDYLPAVLLQLLEEQKRQAQHLDDTDKVLDSIKSTVVAVGEASKMHIAAFEATAQTKLDQLEAAIKDAEMQIQSSKSIFTKQIFEIANAQAGQATKIHEGLSAIALQIESLSVSTQRSQVKCTRILIAGLVASVVTIGLAIAILLRH